MSDALQALGEYIRSALPQAVTGSSIAFGELTLEAQASEITKVISFLQSDSKCQFFSFIDLCGVDYPSRPMRFEVVYHLLSPRLLQRIRIKIAADETTAVPTITGIFPGADWFEREAYDMYGILFSDHPDLRRLLTDYGFEGHPLRKDFPTTGYVEVRYDDQEKRVVYQKVRLNQEMRQFDFLSPWEGVDYVLPGDEKAKQP